MDQILTCLVSLGFLVEKWPFCSTLVYIHIKLSPGQVSIGHSEDEHEDTEGEVRVDEYGSDEPLSRSQVTQEEQREENES